MPEYVWLATGGKQNFKAEKCECLKGRKVILYPDLGAFEDWKNKGETIARSVGFSLSVSDVLERIATPEDRESGFDIADYVIKQLRTGVRSNTGGQTRCFAFDVGRKDITTNVRTESGRITANRCA